MALATAAEVKNYIKNFSTDISDADIADMIEDASAMVNVISRYDWYQASTTLAEQSLWFIRKVVIDLVCIDMITFDLSTFPSRLEAEDMINVHRDSALRGLALLRDQKVVDALLAFTE